MRQQVIRSVTLRLILLGSSSVCLSADGDCFWQLVPNRNGAGMRAARHDLKLEGTAGGGELVLLEMINPNPRYIKIDTEPGEPASAVMARLAAAINEASPFDPFRSRRRTRNKQGELVPGDQVPIVSAEGNLLRSFPGIPGDYVFAGTETGLGRPQGPTSLSVAYDAVKQRFVLTWENPSGALDAIGGNFQGAPLSGTATTVGWDAALPQRNSPVDRGFSRRERRLRKFIVVGCRNGVLSSPATMTWDFDEGSQSDLDPQPYSGGISPNWKQWSHGGQPGELLLEQGTKGEWKRFDQNPRVVVNADDKPFYQLIKTRSPDVVGGVYRKFLGLGPGRTYRLYTRMNTFDMDKAAGDWSFSFHAAAHAANVKLKPEQMAGTESLPVGSAAQPTGQLAAFRPGATTGGKFVERSTGPGGPQTAALDMAMPPGTTVITVWFRYSGAPSTGVGFDWIKLKDVTPG